MLSDRLRMLRVWMHAILSHAQEVLKEDDRDDFIRHELRKFKDRYTVEEIAENWTHIKRQEAMRRLPPPPQLYDWLEEESTG